MIKKNPIVRYKILDELLSNRNVNYTTEDLTNKVNARLEGLGLEPVGRRCIEKDIAALQLAPYEADIERRNLQHGKCLRYADPTFSIFKPKLSAEEENLLSEVLSTLGQFEGLNNFEWMEDLKKRLKVKVDRKIIEFDTNPYLKNRNILGDLFNAISDKVVLHIKYKSFTSDEIYDYELHPYLLKEYNSRWYLVSWSKKWGMRNLAIDRIVSYETMGHIPFVEPSVDLETYYEDVVGITNYKDKEVEDILLWVSEGGVPYLETKPFHASQTRIKGENEVSLRYKYRVPSGGAFFKLKCKLNYELESLIMSKMEQIVVLGPSKLSEDIYRRLKEMTQNYENLM